MEARKGTNSQKDISYDINPWHSWSHLNRIKDLLRSYILLHNSLFITKNSPVFNFATRFQYGGGNWSAILFSQDYGSEGSANREFVDSNSKHIYNLRRNRLFTFRAADMDIAEGFYTYYQRVVNDRIISNKIVMLLEIIILVLSEVILVPIVIYVIKTNNRAHSLFEYI